MITITQTMGLLVVKTLKLTTGRNDIDKYSTHMNACNQPGVKKAELKLLTVVFWDLHNFSNLCDILRASPESVVEFLNEYYDEVEKVVSKYGGAVDKFMGDGVMALFSLKGHDNDDGTNDDAISAVNAAVNLKESFQQSIKSKWREIWERKVSEKIDIGLKCGINTGQAIVAKVGTEKNQYTAIGSVVNYASRFAGLAKDNHVLISQTTKSRVKYKFLSELISVKKLQHAKSFGGVTQCYLVLGRTDEIFPRTH